jgi:hypothetical protein
VDTVSRRGWLPYERGGVAEETLWGADVPMPGAYNCNEAAPGQLVGGWQYLHASPETWRLLLKTFDRRKIPVAWCGRVHSFSLGKPLTRVSVMLHVDAKSISILETYLHSLREGQPMAAHSNSLYLYTDVMPDEELSTALAEVNAILVEQKETKARADTEGRADYSKYLRSP